MVRHPRSLVVGGGWDEIFFWHDMVYYVRKASYDPPEQPLLNREVRGRLRARRRLATLAQIGSQSTVALQYLVLVLHCRGAAGITGYKFRRRCTAMVWLALTNALTRLDLGHITNRPPPHSHPLRTSQGCPLGLLPWEYTPPLPHRFVRRRKGKQ